MNKIIGMFLVLALLFSGCTGEEAEAPIAEGLPVNEGEEPPAEEPVEEPIAYSMEEIGMHNADEDCWLLIEGKAYDVSGYIPIHPGGEAILKGCGIDATEMFSKHSEYAREQLENYYIGDLEG